MIELCARAEGIERFNYVSTAYVAGVRRGVVYEHELVLGQFFRRHEDDPAFGGQAALEQAEASEKVFA